MRSFINDEGKTIVEMTAEEAEELQTSLFVGWCALDNAYLEKEAKSLYTLACALDF